MNKISDLRILTQERLEFILKLNSISYLDEYLECHKAMYKPSKNFTAEIFDNVIQEIQRAEISLQNLAQLYAKLHSQSQTSSETDKSDEEDAILSNHAPKF